MNVLPENAEIYHVTEKNTEKIPVFISVFGNLLFSVRYRFRYLFFSVFIFFGTISVSVFICFGMISVSV